MKNIRSHVPMMDYELTKEEMIPKFQLWAKNEEYMRNNIDFHEIHFDYMAESIEYCWDYILPDCDWDLDRYDLLDAMRIKLPLQINQKNP